jgi:prevent-host-death family protein
MEIYTTSQARANLFKLIEHTAESHDPVYIVGKNNKAVLISEEDYRAMIETLYITSIPGMKESILSASKAPIESFSDKIDWDDV